MFDLYRPIVELCDHFSETVSCAASIIKNFIDTQKRIKISKKRFCKNGKHMRRKNYWKAVYMDISIASRNKHLL